MYATGLTMCVTRAGRRKERCPIWRAGGVGDADGASRTWTDVANMIMVVRMIMITIIIISSTKTKV